MDFTFNVLTQTKSSVQAHLRLDTQDIKAPSFGLFSAHFTDKGGDGTLVIADQTICPPDKIAAVVGRVGGVLQTHLKTTLNTCDIFAIKPPPATPPAAEPPKGFAVAKTSVTPNSHRFALRESNDAGPIGEAVSALIDVFTISPTKTAAQLFILDERIMAENPARQLALWLRNVVKAFPQHDGVTLNIYPVTFLGRAEPQKKPA